MNKEAELFAESVIVTGTHYSMSTLMGQIIGEHSDFHMIHEPLKHQTTLSHEVIPTVQWYQYFEPNRSDELARQLRRIQFGKETVRKSVDSISKIRQFRDVARVAKFTLNSFERSRTAKRAVFKDPFLCFSAKSLQETYGLYVVVTTRHPCGFAESLARRGKGFDFQNLMQPTLLETLPEYRNEIESFANEPHDMIEQAALLWKVVYGFADKHYLRNPKSIMVRQEDLVADAHVEVDRVMEVIGSSRSEAVDKLIMDKLNADNPVDFSDHKQSYTRRDPKQAAEKWRSRMDPAEIDRVMELVGSTAGRFGYEQTL